MFFYEGLSCPHCHRTFREDDDIVSCPVCGAPHHRGCWEDAGGCACAADHGTENQWSRDTAKKASDDTSSNGIPCPRCGSINSKYAEICASCGSPLSAADWASSYTPPSGESAYTPPPYNAYPPPPYQQASPFGGFGGYAPFNVQSPYGAVSPDTVIDGESVRDIAEVVRTNSAHYCQKFDRLHKSRSKISWNWAAFLIPSYWLLHRRQNVAGALVLTIELLFAVIEQFLNMFYFYPVFEATSVNGQIDYYAAAQVLMNAPWAKWPLILLGTISFVSLLIHIYVGLFGNHLYMRGCIKAIRRAKAEYPEGYRSQLSMIGGTSFASAITAYLIVSLVPSIISTLFLSF